MLAEYQRKGSAGWADPPNTRAARETVRSYVADLLVVQNGEVLNPGGRTGLTDGRGLLGRTVNFAADPIIFRCIPENGVLEILLIFRSDTKEWVLPGGMTDFGETVPQTLRH